MNSETVIKIRENRSYLVEGEVKLVHPDGSEEIRTGPIYLCSCNRSATKPFCDGTHKKPLTPQADEV